MGMQILNQEKTTSQIGEFTRCGNEPNFEGLTEIITTEMDFLTLLYRYSYMLKEDGVGLGTYRPRIKQLIKN